MSACAHALQDVGSLVELARRRCADDKAGVRKAAVQLLEALLLLRASGSGGAEAVLPSGTDVEAIQHAAADPMVGPCGLRLRSMTSMSSVKLTIKRPSSTLCRVCSKWDAMTMKIRGCQGHDSCSMQEIFWKAPDFKRPGS